MKNEIVKKGSNFLIYQGKDGKAIIDVRFDEQDVWLTQSQIAMLFDTTQQNVSLHINSILEEGELLKEATYKYFLLVRQEGNRSVKRQIEHYNLDMIISVGYRIKSQVAHTIQNLGNRKTALLHSKGIYHKYRPFKKS
jgi:hypothetical protein